MHWLNWRSISAAAAYVGAAIGAGLFSGRESAQFFIPFGHMGMHAALSTIPLFAIAGSLILYIAWRQGAVCYRDFLLRYLPGQLVNLLDYTLSFFLFCTIAIMGAGAGALLAGISGISPACGTVALLTFTAIILFFGRDGFLRANAGMVLVLIVIILLVANSHGVSWVPTHDIGDMGVINWGLTPRCWLASSIVYAGYNVALSLPLLVTLGGGLRSAGEAWVAGIGGGVILGLMVVILSGTLISNAPLVLITPIPMLLVVRKVGDWAIQAYIVGMLLALATTAVASAYALAHRLTSHYPPVEKWAGLALVFLALPFSTLGFMSLVRTVYPLLGYAAILLIVAAGLFGLCRFTVHKL